MGEGEKGSELERRLAAAIETLIDRVLEAYRSITTPATATGVAVHVGEAEARATAYAAKGAVAIRDA